MYTLPIHKHKELLYTLLVTVNTIEIDNNGTERLKESSIDSLIISEKAIMSIDGSTTITGVSLVNKTNSNIVAIASFRRDKDRETPVAYKVRLKREISKILLKNTSSIQDVIYEEPFIGYGDATINLMMLRTFIEEIIVENEPKLNNIKYIEVNNKKWKKLWLYPDKCPANSELEKKAVKDKLISIMPFFSALTQDEVDATAMGIVASKKLVDGKGTELESKKKRRKFLYNTEFLAVDNDDNMISELHYMDNIPKEVMSNGIRLVELKNRSTNFENTIYNEMGDEDKLLVIRFNPRYYGNILLKYQIGYLVEDGENRIYAFAWRKNRKAKKEI